MTKQITIKMSETDAVTTFVVPEGFVERFANEKLTDGEFDAVADSVYATLTHDQKKVLFAEALETHNNVVDYLSTQDNITQDLYVVSARQHLATCISCSLADYYEEVTA